MQFVSINFLVFFFITIILYFILPHKLKWVWLLICSYYFYINLNSKYAIFLLISTLITYLSGLFLEKSNEITNENMCIKIKKLIVILSFSSNIGILFLFKYLNFFSTTLVRLFNFFSISIYIPTFNSFLPLGISFYTLQALSYTIDVYRNDVKAEKNLGKYALFVAFFPQIISGPIEKSKNMLHQFNEKHAFDYDRVKNGLLLMLWGVFVKLIVADRLAMLVNTVYGNPQKYSGFEIFIASIFFTFQIYLDFSSYSDIASGIAEVMGFKITNNFNQPYFSRSIKEFWSRWHISLTSWFRDYLYFPLGGSRKGRLRTYLNIMAIFLISGLWHGAGLTFIIWGLLHGLYRILEEVLKPFKKKVILFLNINTEVFSFKLLQVLKTFLLVNFAWIFFRATSFLNSITIIKRMFYFNPWIFTNGSLYKLGLDPQDFFIAIVGIIVVLTVNIIQRNTNTRLELSNQNILFRWIIYLALVISCLIFGIYGPGYNIQQFIYSQF